MAFVNHTGHVCQRHQWLRVYQYPQSTPDRLWLILNWHPSWHSIYVSIESQLIRRYIGMNKGQNWLKFSDFSCTYTLSLHLPCAGLFQFRCLLLPLILQAQSPYARMSSKSFFHKFIFIFKLGGATKHLMTDWPKGKSEFWFPIDTQCSPCLHFGEISRSQGNKTHCFPWASH